MVTGSLTLRAYILFTLALKEVWSFYLSRKSFPGHPLLSFQKPKASPPQKKTNNKFHHITLHKSLITIRGTKHHMNMDSPLIPFIGSTRAMYYELFDKKVVNYHSFFNCGIFLCHKSLRRPSCVVEAPIPDKDPIGNL